jgi:hypothetical protein
MTRLDRVTVIAKVANCEAGSVLRDGKGSGPASDDDSLQLFNSFARPTWPEVCLSTSDWPRVDVPGFNRVSARSLLIVFVSSNPEMLGR